MNAELIDKDLREIIHIAEELASKVLARCEKQLGSSTRPLTRPQAALTTTAMTIHQLIETFIVVSKIEEEQNR